MKLNSSVSIFKSKLNACVSTGRQGPEGASVEIWEARFTAQQGAAELIIKTFSNMI